jgi:polyhydroxyalkanoate synthase subunit PhaC
LEIETALAPCGHLALLMGRRSLTEEWPRIAQWLAK